MSDLIVPGWEMAGEDGGPPFPLSEQDEEDAAGEWSPCRYPERPFDLFVSLHDCCRPCLIAAEAAHRSGSHLAPASLVAYMRDRLDEYGEAAP